MLISASDNLMWIVWEAIRRLAKVRYNAGEVTIHVIRKYDDDDDEPEVNHANAFEILSNFSGGNIKEARDFSRSSSEVLYFLRVPANYIEVKTAFDIRVSRPDCSEMGSLT